MKEYLKTWSRPGRPTYAGNCFIWNDWGNSTITELWEPTGPHESVLRGHWVNSERADGHYVLWQNAKPFADGLYEQQKARLTTWLIDQRTQGDLVPEITPERLEYAIHRPSLQVHERAERLLKCLAYQADTIGADIDIKRDTPSPYAWSESTVWEEVAYLLNYLRECGWLSQAESDSRMNGLAGLDHGVVTVAGYNQIAELTTAVDSTQAFVAMWFNPDVNQVYDHGIRPAVEAAGFTPYRVDRENFLGKIDDQIIAEIRRSRLLIADMTHGNEGARGSVYFEAGFALGLGIPMIYTCRSDMFNELHFDTRQYPHLGWTNLEIDTFRQNLENKIRATIV